MHALTSIIITAAFLACLATAAPAPDRDRGFDDHARGIIDRTQNDLRMAADFERHKGKETARYENAQKHLSDFDREFVKGHFDKGKLDTAIDDVKNVVDHNTLDPEARDALRRDLADLRAMRSEHDH